jgi:hypothetical protein
VIAHFKVGTCTAGFKFEKHITLHKTIKKKDSELFWPFEDISDWSELHPRWPPSLKTDLIGLSFIQDGNLHLKQNIHKYI